MTGVNSDKTETEFDIEFGKETKFGKIFVNADGEVFYGLAKVAQVRKTWNFWGKRERR